MKILAFLQNQWFKPKSIVTVQRIYREHGTTPEDRADLNARLLFLNSLTGRRLTSAFGDLCDSIIWEEISKEVGSFSASAFKADHDHIRACLIHFKPDIVLAFGKIAQDGVYRATLGRTDFNINYFFMAAPHPAARHKNVAADLKLAAMEVMERISR